MDAVVGKDLVARETRMTDTNPVPGGLVLFGGGGYDKKYGHIAVVTGVNEDGTINVRESNFNGNSRVTERKNVPRTFVKGFYNKTPVVEGKKEYSQPAMDKLAAFNNGTADYDTIMKQIGSTKAGLKIKGEFDALVASQ